MSETDGPKPTLTVHADGPAAQIVRDALQPTTLPYENAKGAHSITVQKPGPLMAFKLSEVLGPERASNPDYKQLCEPLTWIVAVDGEPRAFPNSHLGLEGLIVELGSEGMDALTLWYMETVMLPAMAMFEAASQKAKDEALKNG